MTREEWLQLPVLDRADCAVYFLEAALTSLPPPDDPGRARWHHHELACRYVLAHFLSFRQQLLLAADTETDCHDMLTPG